MATKISIPSLPSEGRSSPDFLSSLTHPGWHPILGEVPFLLRELATVSDDGLKQVDRVLAPYHSICPPTFLRLKKQRTEAFSTGKLTDALPFVINCHKISLFFRELIKIHRGAETSGSLPDKAFLDRIRVKTENLAFLIEMDSKYGRRAHLTAAEALRPEARTAIQDGSLSLLEEESSATFESKLQRITARADSAPESCELLEHAPPLSSLPDQPARESYWKEASLPLRSERGHEGIFYVAHPSSRADLVVKVSSYPYRELFAAKVAQTLGIPTPDTLFIPRSSEEGVLIEAALKESKNFRSSCAEKEFPGFLVMSRVYGVCLEEVDRASAAAAFNHYPASIEQVFEEIGRIAALDIILFYQDRLSHTGLTNTGNIMLASDHRFFPHAVAIDQNVSVSIPSFVLSPTDKIKRAATLIDTFFESPSSASTITASIWEDIPEALKEWIDPSQAEKCLYRGIEKGFQQIKKELTEERLRSIEEDCKSQFPIPSLPRDVVNISDLHAIREHLLSVSP